MGGDRRIFGTAPQPSSHSAERFVSWANPRPPSPAALAAKSGLPVSQAARSGKIFDVGWKVRRICIQFS
jgi:hypothetical protein